SFVDVACVFFFQAEDGIRDRNVTGVQTCALPILMDIQDFVSCMSIICLKWEYCPRMHLIKERCIFFEGGFKIHGSNNKGSNSIRSEERRVGKECRDRWSRNE